MPGDESDEELLIRGDPEGFGRLYERRLGLVRGYLRRRIGAQPDLVLDLVAETLSLGLFVYTPKCAEHESFTVVYLNTGGPSYSAPHESVIVGRVKLSESRLR